MPNGGVPWQTLTFHIEDTGIYCLLENYEHTQINDTSAVKNVRCKYIYRPWSKQTSQLCLPTKGKTLLSIDQVSKESTSFPTILTDLREDHIRTLLWTCHYHSKENLLVTLSSCRSRQALSLSKVYSSNYSSFRRKCLCEVYGIYQLCYLIFRRFKFLKSWSCFLLISESQYLSRYSVNGCWMELLATYLPHHENTQSGKCTPSISWKPWCVILLVIIQQSDVWV